jgi:hypothetical protein
MLYAWPARRASTAATTAGRVVRVHPGQGTAIVRDDGQGAPAQHGQHRGLGGARAVEQAEAQAHRFKANGAGVVG